MTAAWVHQQGADDAIAHVNGIEGAQVTLANGCRLSLVNDLDPVTPVWYVLLGISGSIEWQLQLPADLRLWPPLVPVTGSIAAVPALQGIRSGLLLLDTRDFSWRWTTPDDEAGYHVEVIDDTVLVVRHGINGAVTRFGLDPDGQLTDPIDLQTGSLQTQSSVHAWDVDDGRLNGILTLPYSPAAARLPLIVDLHGGPAPGLRIGHDAQGDDLAALWCAAGYAHWRPEYRSSGALGRAAMWDQYRDRRSSSHDKEIDDVCSAIAAISTHPNIDAGQTTLIGFSYGAYLANRIATAGAHPFRRIICWEGIADPRRLDPQDLALHSRWLGATPAGAPDAWAQTAPAAFASRVDVPILLLYGYQSQAAGHGRAWFHTLQAAGKNVTMRIIDNEQHVFTRTGRQALVGAAAHWLTSGQH